MKFVLFSLSFDGIQQFLNICDIYAKDHDLLYNGGKSYYVLNLTLSDPGYFRQLTIGGGGGGL